MNKWFHLHDCVHFCFSECSVLYWLIVPYGFYLKLPQLSPFESFSGLWLGTCIRAVYQKRNSRIVSPAWLIFVLLPLNKRGFVLMSDYLDLFPSHFLILFACFPEVCWNPFCQNILYDKYLHSSNQFSTVERVMEFFIVILFYWR